MQVTFVGGQEDGRTLDLDAEPHEMVFAAREGDPARYTLRYLHVKTPAGMDIKPYYFWDQHPNEEIIKLANQLRGVA